MLRMNCGKGCACIAGFRAVLFAELFRPVRVEVEAEEGSCIGGKRDHNHCKRLAWCLLSFSQDKWLISMFLPRHPVRHRAAPSAARNIPWNSE